MAKYEARIEVSKEINVLFETPLFTGDIGNTVKLAFFLRGQPYSGEGAEVYCKLTDGNTASVSAVTEGNTLEFTIPNNMYPNPGELELQIALLDGAGNVLTSGVLHFEVLEGLSGQADIVGTDQYNDMTALLAEVGQSLGNAKAATDQCLSATVGATVAEARAIQAAEAAESVIENIPSNYDIVFNQDTDLSTYAGKTITGKTVFFQSSQSLESVVNITFSRCTIYGNGKAIGTLGLTKFTNCVMYDLNFSSPIIWGDETNDYTTTAGSCSCTGCTIYGGSIWDYWDPGFSGCKVMNCAISGYGQTFSTKDSVYINCDFNSCGPAAMAENEYNIFTNCDHFGGYSALTGQCYFSGCRGSVSVSSEAVLKPSTTTAFADQNFADLTIS